VSTALKPGNCRFKVPNQRLTETGKLKTGRHPKTYHKERITSMKRLTKNIGMLLLAIFLIAWGLVQLIPALSGLGLILAILAIAAGIFILLDR
jgi:hypothetical protein